MDSIYELATLVAVIVLAVLRAIEDHRRKRSERRMGGWLQAGYHEARAAAEAAGKSTTIPPPIAESGVPQPIEPEHTKSTIPQPPTLKGGL